jgi:putative peptidoglycan binding protein/CHAP domain-containing protein
MTTIEQVLDRARSQLGVTEHPPGSNRIPYNDWYGVQGPWCAMFVSWCTYQEGLALPASTAKGFAYTPSGASWFKRRGRWTMRPAEGLVVFFDFPGDSVDRISHVGIVEQVRPDGTIVTIEGNTDERGGRTGGKVMRKARSSGIVGYGIPDYDELNGNGGGPAAPPYPGRELRLGMTDPGVRMVQGRLVQLGIARLAVDGDFGPQTRAAVEEFQRRHGLEVDGILGPLTWKALWA